MYDTVEHESTVEMFIKDVEPTALFTESLLALSDVLSDATGGTSFTHEVEINGPDLDGLLLAWVNELVRLAETDGFVPERVYEERLDSSSFRARVAGERGIPPDRIRGLNCRSIETKRLHDGAWAVHVTLDPVFTR